VLLLSSAFLKELYLIFSSTLPDGKLTLFLFLCALPAIETKVVFGVVSKEFFNVYLFTFINLFTILASFSSSGNS